MSIREIKDALRTGSPVAPTATAPAGTTIEDAPLGLDAAAPTVEAPPAPEEPEQGSKSKK